MDQIDASYAKLSYELERFDDRTANCECVDGWTVRDLLAVRVWWTEAVVDWIRRGQRGQVPVTPAPGYTWSETPRLNADIVESTRDRSFGQLQKRLAAGVNRVLATIAELDDTQLLEPGVYRWAGRWPLSRWLSINTVRQYTTARSHLRRVLRLREGR